MPQFWTPEQVVELLRRYGVGENSRVIGAAMGFTRNAVIGKLDRLRRKRTRKKRRRRR
jgi:hypothetical protein